MLDKAWIRQLLDRYFPDETMRAEQVQEIVVETDVVDFPRSIWCKCKKCRSEWVIKVVVGSTLTLKTEEGVRVKWIAGDAAAFAHV